MTTPAERTRSISGTRRFLESIADGIYDVDTRLVRTLAVCLLKHFPSDEEISASSDSLPSVWAPPRPMFGDIDAGQPRSFELVREIYGDRGPSRSSR